MKTAPLLTHYLLDKGAISSVTLVDVGASGGIPATFRTYGNALEAICFDEIKSECDRLNGIEPLPNVRYHPYRIESAKSHITIEHPLHERLQFSVTHPAIGWNQKENYNNFSSHIEFTSETSSLDDWFSGRKGYLDFLKIDTDGYDLDVLRSAGELFSKGHFLGIHVEVFFHNSPHADTSNFSIVDPFLRGQGFTLYDLELVREPRHALPTPYDHHRPFINRNGQLQFANALYFRDLAEPARLGKRPEWTTPSHILKLASFYELFGLYDCAAELILSHRNMISNVVDPERCLDLLVQHVSGFPNGGKPRKYKEYMQDFQRHINVMRIIKQCDSIYDAQFDVDYSFREESGRKIVFWGAGKRFSEVFEDFGKHFSKCELVCIIDSAPEKQGHMCKGLSIHSPEILSSIDFDMLIVTSYACLSIITNFIELFGENHNKSILLTESS